MFSDEIFYAICLLLSNDIGNIRGKKLVSACGSAYAVFKEKKTTLLKIPGINKAIVTNLTLSNQIIKKAEKEIEFINKYNIKPLLFNDPKYPQRLKHCDDGPLLLYVKGNANLNSTKVLSIVGTRKATVYGKNFCKELIQQLNFSDLLIISGLALGIDTCAHNAAIDNNIPTAAILAHGLDIIYPQSNRALAAKMLENGALISEFISNTKPDRENFPQRNRIIAGMSDAVIVVEASLTGGALITANIANSYNRDVFALPGRVTDLYSKGCNQLIRDNKAALIQSADDIKYFMGWNVSNNRLTHNLQKNLFQNFSEEEKSIINILEVNGESSIDFLCNCSGMTNSKISSVLLNLEIQGIIKAMPGKRYILI